MATTGETGPVDRKAIDALRNRFNGALLRPGDEGFDVARRVWNGMVDERRALIARCTGVPGVQAAVRFGREQGLLASVKGGGHQVAGHAVAHGGLMIDLSLMRGAKVGLRALKDRWDPTNYFRLNQNVPPSAG